MRDAPLDALPSERDAGGCEEPDPSPLPAPLGGRSYLAPHHIDLALAALRQAAERSTRPMPVAWRMLQDLYRARGRETEIDELARRFQDRVDAFPAAGTRVRPVSHEPGLEAFPRLVREITHVWGTHECRRLLDRLLYDGRTGIQPNFTLNAYADLLALRRACDDLLRTIEADFVEEASLREAFAAATARLSNADSTSARRGEQGDRSVALTRELEAQLADDLRIDTGSRSSLEVEHPALAGMLVHEWGNPALAARLCEILSSTVAAGHRLSPEAFADLETLRRVADELARESDGRYLKHCDSDANIRR